MKILGIKPDSLIEWPGQLSFVIFIAGCNFRCPFCYVPYLVLPEKYQQEEIKEISQEKILKQIQERAEFIDAICITGGEPTIHSELYDFIKNIKEIVSIPIRLETNGTNPKLIEKLLQEKLIDSIALDIKNSREKYQETSCSDINLFDITKTISLIKEAEIDYEIRTTLVPGLHNKEDLLNIAEWLKDKEIKNYVLQQFHVDLPGEQTLNPEFIKKGNYPSNELENIKNHLENLGYFEKVEVRA